MYKLTAALLVTAMLAGCVANQKRENPSRDLLTGVDVKPYVQRHGGYGHEVAELFNTGKVHDAFQDYSGKSHGLELDAFYRVQIAENPQRPTVLTDVGYIRKVKQDRGKLFLYEFYDGAWKRIGYLGQNGSLYRYDAGKETLLGRFELDQAVRQLYYAPGGYGYDAELQDYSLAHMDDHNLSGLDSRARGVYLRDHKTAPPVVVFSQLNAGQAALLSERYTKKRTEDRWKEEAARLHQEKTEGYGEDETYGGLQYKNGEPVDRNGRPLRPGDVK